MPENDTPPRDGFTVDLPAVYSQGGFVQVRTVILAPVNDQSTPNDAPSVTKDGVPSLPPAS